MKKINILIIIFFLAGLAIAVRLLPHPANFTPVAAVALFAAYYLPKKWSILLPLTVLLVSDLFLGFYDLKLMLVVYGCFLLSGIIGLAVRNNRNVLNVITASLASSLGFFIITNLAVWYFSSWYAHNWSGLMQCYALAVPFFRNTLLGDLFFVGILFGSYEMIKIAQLKRLSASIAK